MYVVYKLKGIVHFSERTVASLPDNAELILATHDRQRAIDRYGKELNLPKKQG